MNVAMLGELGQHFAYAGSMCAAGVYGSHQQAEGSDQKQHTTSKNGKATENHER
ncbi:hypothetical protein SAMN05428936_103333 [Pelagibacterium halotolerans]|nr:hypothetical protein SAMN05428936_103333 [Pelagibacterium halotolerans]